mgnify:CR=1 FL=1
MGPEAKVDARVRDYAADQGWFSLKLTSLGMYGVAGIPDRLYLRLGYAFFMEMKKPGGLSTPLQLERQQQLRNMGFNVYVVDDPIVGKRVIDKETEICERRKLRPRRHGT